MFKILVMHEMHVSQFIHYMTKPSACEITLSQYKRVVGMFQCSNGNGRYRLGLKWRAPAGGRFHWETLMEDFVRQYFIITSWHGNAFRIMVIDKEMYRLPVDYPRTDAVMWSLDAAFVGIIENLWTNRRVSGEMKRFNTN